MNANYQRVQLKGKSWLGKFFRFYRGWLLFFGILALLAFVTGILTVSKVSDDLELDKLPSKAIIVLFEDPKNNWGYFIQQLLSFFYIIAIVLLCNFHPCMIWVDILIVLYHFYCFGFCFLGIILLYSVAGFFNLLLFILPFFLLYSFIILLLVCICVKRCILKRKYGSVCSPTFSYKELQAMVWVLVASLLLILLLQTLFIPIISITIIV